MIIEPNIFRLAGTEKYTKVFVIIDAVIIACTHSRLFSLWATYLAVEEIYKIYDIHCMHLNMDILYLVRLLCGRHVNVENPFSNAQLRRKIPLLHA